MKKALILFGGLVTMFGVGLIYGCSHHLYIEEHAQEWLARPVSELRDDMKRPDSYASKIKWEETTYPLSNGYYVFVEPLAKDCNMHWDVNNRDRIIGYRTAGTGCEFKSSETSTDNPNTLQTVTKPSNRW
jgi:hypothetical protein